MNDFPSTPDPLLNPLFSRARAERTDTSRAEYAFETRLLARLQEKQEPARNGIGLLAWRLLPVFALLVVGLGVVQFEASGASQEAEQAAVFQNPDAVDLFFSLEQ